MSTQVTAVFRGDGGEQFVRDEIVEQYGGVVLAVDGRGTYERVDAALAALTRNQRSLVGSVTRRSVWLALAAVGAVPRHAGDPLALCLDRHRLPSARVPCAECVTDATREG